MADSPRPDTDASVEFLLRWEPTGPWVLTSIEPDRKAISTATFDLTKVDEMRRWIESYNGNRNIYFHVNRVISAMSKKAERTDIREVSWLHVDIDPRVGEDIASERTRALGLLQGYEPRPTVIVDSGGGYQGFWRLEEPIPIGGDLARAEDAKRYNLQLELHFGADNCHNIDRIMRLPGTINIPDLKKKKKGRVPALAQVVEFSDASYPIRLFLQAPEIQSSETAGFSSGKVQVSGNIPRTTDLDELGETVPGRIKVLIAQGMDPDEPDKYSSRSEALFAVIVSLVRASVTDDVIYGIITDPSWKIAESVLDKKRYEKYAVRQIERAHEEAIHPELRKLNERHAVIGDIGGKCRVISEVFDPSMKRTRISRQSFDDFRNRYMHIQVELGKDPSGKVTVKKLGQWWLEHSMHRHYETMCFSPGQEVEGAYNLWKGFDCEARPGDCSRFLEHMKTNICSGNQEHYDYLLSWMARGVQRPDTPGEVAVILRGRMGTGKGMFIRTYGSLFGRHFLQISDAKHLVGSFNSHLRDCVVLFADEAFFAGDKKHESILKSLITEPFVTFESKGVDAEAGPNYTHILMASNSSWVIPAGGDERRYLVMDVGDDQMQNAAYFREIVRELENGGREALLHLLLTHDLSEFDHRKVPKTAALQEQKLLSLSSEEEWWYTKLNEGRLLTRDHSWRVEVEKDELFGDFYNYMQKLGQPRRATKTSLSHFLGRVLPSGYPIARQRWVEKAISDERGFSTTVKERPYFYLLPELSGCRDSWDKKYGEADWPVMEPVDQQEIADGTGVPF